MENRISGQGSSTIPQDKEMPPLTTFEISNFLHVDLTTVIHWCEQGKLKAYKTPGGHRRVLPLDFLDFLHKFNMPVPSEFEKRSTGGLKVLIVDDEQDVRRMISRVLGKNFPQVQIFEAKDGFEAGKMVLDVLPGLVILDLKLPGIDGFKVCSDIKEDERFGETRILAITGQNTEENRKKILDSGADGYLAKPFEIKDLIEKINSLLWKR